MEEQEDHQLLTVDQWNEWWKKDYERSKRKVEGSGHEHSHDNPFNQPSPMLQKHRESLTPKQGGKRIFVPLCGKSPDMKWLMDEGYEVVGIECSEHAILEFFDENSIEFESEYLPTHPEFRVFKGKTANIRIFQGDYFKFTPDVAQGVFDCVWDTASLNTIDLPLRKPYVDVVRSLMAGDARYMLSAMYFGKLKTWKNNPFDITDEDMKEIFGGNFTWTKIDEDDTEWGLERVFLILRS